jgi:hypothetical protein
VRAYSPRSRTSLWMGLSAAIAVGMTTLLIGYGRVRASADTSNQTADQSALDDARKEVERLEAHLRATEAGLAKARVRLATLEAGVKGGAPEVQAVPGNAADKKLEGVWRIVGINGHHQGEFQKPPYDEYKIMTAGHYLWLSFRPETGEVLRSGGGVYTLKDGEYKARIECSNSSDLRSIVGKEYSGRCIIEGDKWYHNGNVPNGAPFDEVWQRVR